MKRKATLIAALAATALLLSACEEAKEEYRDAPVSGHDDSPVEIYNFPDGFSNVASKCDKHGNRIYTTMNSNGRAVAVSPQDPSCKADR